MGAAEVAELVRRTVPAMRRGGLYRPPRGAEPGVLEALAGALARADAVAAVEAGRRLGLASDFASDDAGGALVLRSDPHGERAWLVVVLRPGVVPDVVVEVPHPNADVGTELVGLALRERRAGALYLQAGAHRVAGAPPTASDRADCPADVAAREDSPFALVAAVLAARGLPQLQVHGFADRDDVDVVLSPGAAGPGALFEAVRARVDAGGERVGTGEDPRWADLLGLRNVQGRAAARAGAAFVHLELSRALRRDHGRRAAVTGALADALEDVLPECASQRHS